MATGATTVSVIGVWLKKQYQKKIQDYTKKDAFVYSHLTDSEIPFGGDTLEYPVMLELNSSFGARGDAGTLPAAGHILREVLSVDVRYVYVRGQLTGPTMAKARTNKHAFAVAMKSEMDGAKKAMKQGLNHQAILGERVKGFLCERKASSLTAAAQNQVGLAADAGQDTWVYDGDYDEFDGTKGTAVVAADPTTWVRIDIRRMDTHAQVELVGAPTNMNFFVSDYDKSARTIEISVTADLANDGFTTLNIADYAAHAVVLHDTQAVDSAVPALNIGQAPRINQTDKDGWDVEVQGIFYNLANQDYFGLDRETAANAAARSTIVTMSTAVAGGRAALAPLRLQEVMDTILDSDGEEGVDVILINALQRSKYVSVAGLVQNVSGAKASGIDTGTSMAKKKGKSRLKLDYNGIPFWTDKDIPNGVYGLFASETWRRAVTKDPEFADDDGNVLSRVQNQDAYEFMLRAYLNIFCTRPAANALIVGAT